MKIESNGLYRPQIFHFTKYKTKAHIPHFIDKKWKHYHAPSIHAKHRAITKTNIETATKKKRKQSLPGLDFNICHLER